MSNEQERPGSEPAAGAPGSESPERAAGAPDSDKREAEGSEAFGREPAVETGGGGFASGLFSIIMMLLVTAEVLYLTKDLGMRIDLTQDKLYTLSGSTAKVLDKLDEPLVIEAYFSEKIPGNYQQQRSQIRDLLDEYVKLGRGRVRLVYFDPLEDERIRDKAIRLGISEGTANVVERDSLQTVRVFQGIRLRYGGDRQKVLGWLAGATQLESELTPKIQELVFERKPKVGFFVRAPQRSQFPQQQQQEPGWNLIQRALDGRYETQRIDLSNGQLLPEDMEVLVVAQPKDLTDWEKYCIDQHVMGGGNMIVLQEAVDYSIDQWSSFYRVPLNVDAMDSKLKWKDQLASYGVDTTGKLVADMLRNVIITSYKVIQYRGGYAVQPQPMPYWFQCLAVDWKKRAAGVLGELGTSEELEKTLGEGLDVKHPALAGQQTLPFFWATDIALKDPLPEGVEGAVLARTSPLALTEPPPMSSDPTDALRGKLTRRIQNEPRRQIPLAVLVKGRFVSAFKDKKVPSRPGQDKDGGLLAHDPVEKPQPEKKQGEKKQDTEAQPGRQGQKEQKEQGETKKAETKQAAEAQQAPKATSAKAGEQQEEKKAAAGQEEGQKGAEKKAQTPESEAQSETEQAKKTEEQLEAEEAGQAEGYKLPPMLAKSNEDSRIVVIGDASMFRDDFLQGVPPVRMPNSQAAAPFFLNMLDWMALDTDLVELRRQRDVDRRLTFVSADLDLDPEQVKARVAAKKFFLRWLNVLGPVIVLLGFGLLVFVKRSAERNRFLASVEEEMPR